MADEITAAPESPAPAAAPAAPAVATPPIAAEAVPSAPSTPAPVAAAEPVSAPAAAPDPIPAKPAEPAAATPAADAAKTTPEPTSLLGEAVPAPEPKAEAKPEGDKPAADAKPEGEAPASEEARPEEAPLPTYDVFTVPEGVELEDAQVDKFVGALGSIERDVLAKVPVEHRDAVHAGFQKLGQDLLDQYTDEISRVAGEVAERVAQVNAGTFSRTMENWKEEFFNDPEIGGNRKDTTIRAASGVIGRFGGSAQQIAEVRQVLSHTGAGNSIHVIRLFNNIASFLREPSPVPALNPEPQQKTRTERRYGKK